MLSLDRRLLYSAPDVSHNDIIFFVARIVTTRCIAARLVIKIGRRRFMLDTDDDELLFYCGQQAPVAAWMLWAMLAAMLLYWRRLRDLSQQSAATFVLQVGRGLAV